MKPRIGKTAKDHKSGAHARCIANKEMRANWQNSRGAPFPWRTCNGKRNKQK